MIWPLDECAPTVWVHITLAKPRTYKIWQIFLKLCKYTNPTENKHTETVTHSKTAAIVAELFYKITTIYKCLWHWTSQCPIKKQCQANHAPYMSKTLRRAVVSRSQTVTKYLKTRTQTDVKLCSKLYKSEWRHYFESSHMKHGFECKEFWKTMKIFLFNKKTVFSQICIEKITELYLMTLICLKILVSFVKILLDCSMSSQMEEELFTSH